MDLSAMQQNITTNVLSVLLTDKFNDDFRRSLCSCKIQYFTKYTTLQLFHGNVALKLCISKSYNARKQQGLLLSHIFLCDAEHGCLTGMMSAS